MVKDHSSVKNNQGDQGVRSQITHASSENSWFSPKNLFLSTIKPKSVVPPPENHTLRKFCGVADCQRNEKFGQKAKVIRCRYRRAPQGRGETSQRGGGWHPCSFVGWNHNFIWESEYLCFVFFWFFFWSSFLETDFVCFNKPQQNLFTSDCHGHSNQSKKILKVLWKHTSQWDAAKVFVSDQGLKVQNLTGKEMWFIFRRETWGQESRTLDFLPLSSCKTIFQSSVLCSQISEGPIIWGILLWEPVRYPEKWTQTFCTFSSIILSPGKYLILSLPWLLFLFFCFYFSSSSLRGA